MYIWASLVAQTVKNLPAMWESWVRSLGRFPGGGHGHPFQYSCLENLMDRGSWWATVHGVTKESDRTEQLILRFILYLLFITSPPSCPPSISPPLPLSFFPFNSWIITTSKQMASLPSGVPGQRMIHQAP